MVLYRKYRPQTFAEMIGQSAIKDALRQAVSKGTLSHALLFSGPRGAGKTTAARIIAKAVNCLKLKNGDPCAACESCVAITNGSHMDVIELDAASNRGIDDVRALQERLYLAPTQGQKKVYIIDEVHMLTTEACNALLKTIEEPPSHVLLILATTDPNKLPKTILSRVSQFSFHLATPAELTEALQTILAKEKKTINDELLEALVLRAEGSFRDATKLLDQVLATDDGGQALIDQGTAFTTHQSAQGLCEVCFSSDMAAAIQYLTDLYDRGEQLPEILVTAMALLRKEIIGQVVHKTSTTDWPVAKMVKLLRLLSVADREMKLSPIAPLPIELALYEWFGETGGEEIVVKKAVAPKSKDKPVEKHDNPAESNQAAEDQPIPPEEIGAMLAEQSDNIVMTEEEFVETQLEQTEEPIKPTAKTTSDVATKEQLISLWPQFLSHVVQHNASVALLVKNAQIADFDGDTLTLEVYYSFHKERLDNDKMRKLAEMALAEVVGKPIRLTSIVGQRKAKKHDDIADDAMQIFGVDG